MYICNTLVTFTYSERSIINLLKERCKGWVIYPLSVMLTNVFDLNKGVFKSYILIDCIHECLNLKKMLWEDSFIVLNSSGFLEEIKFYDRNSISSDSSSENVICRHLSNVYFTNLRQVKWNKYFFKQLKTCKGCAYVASHLIV